MKPSFIALFLGLATFITSAQAQTELPAPTPLQVVIEFHIANGTQEGPWNTDKSVVHVKLGQILRVINDDTIGHRMHTDGAPCPHGPQIEPGKTWDCLVSKPFTGVLYDHQFGQPAAFYIDAK
jgi:hypothetical protein